MDALLEKVKKNLILEHSADDMLLQSYITAAISYAEKYQHFPDRYYSENDMPTTTEQAVIMLASHFYESRDGGTRFLCRHKSGGAADLDGCQQPSSLRQRMAGVVWALGK